MGAIESRDLGYGQEALVPGNAGRAHSEMENSKITMKAAVNGKSKLDEMGEKRRNSIHTAGMRTDEFRQD